MPGIFTIQALAFLALYFILILSFLTGWLRTKKYRPNRQSLSTRVSILIPCRNEADHIVALAEILNNQDYPSGLLEIIWIDDHSTDSTNLLLTTLTNHYNNYNNYNNYNSYNLLLSSPLPGKKSALQSGMKAATGDLILLTDADSRPGKQWVSAMVGYFEQSGSDLIMGPVILDPANSAFSKIQKLEYLSLVASSIGSSGIHRPTMAQGPNIAVRASDYREIVNDLNNRFASGDDVFLLQSMKLKPGKKINYILCPDAIVRSKPAASVSGFFRQRSRWASKASGYRDPFLIFTTLIVFITNIEILAAIVAAALGIAPFSLILLLLGIKTLADLPLLLIATRFFGCPVLLWWFLPVQIFYPFYIAIAGLLSQIAPVRWK